MSYLADRAMAIKCGKSIAIVALSAFAIALSAPISGAAHQAEWVRGCRGYWYSTSGHAYCYNATKGSGLVYDVNYDCTAQMDIWRARSLPYGYQGKWDSDECTFEINSTRVA
ncbi:hypothetical protein ABT354_04075 [Streptomyces sp. NPDC000594]|uniref:hypothetical protein n=1 Tax=Streptomyces sp. NPDC000594 TaxID=3154261 RepID=UPI00331FBB33